MNSKHIIRFSVIMGGINTILGLTSFFNPTSNDYIFSIFTFLWLMLALNMVNGNYAFDERMVK